MKRLMRSASSIILITSLWFFSVDSLAQEGGGDSDIIKDSVNDITLVVAAGITGAILGISTLPFVDKPKEHLNSILIGGSIGIILGVGFVAYSQAMKGRSTFQTMNEPSIKFDTEERYTWHHSNHEKVTRSFSSSDKDVSAINYSFTF